jgi:glutamyl-tRNA reductase
VGAASVSSAAVELAKKIFGSLKAGARWCSALAR